MAVKYILDQIGNKIGLNPADTNQRAVLLRYLNEAARELYPQCDMEGSLVEQVFKVNGDQTISLPAHVETIRAIRELNSQIAWHPNRLRPRYNQFNWTDMWRNWRLKNRQCLQATVINQSIGVISVTAVETPPIVVTVSGPTESATCVSETITMDATSKSTTNQYLDYVSFTKDRVNNYDVRLADVDDRTLTVIPNNELQAVYQIIDVSQLPFLPQDVSVQSNYVEVLYKKKLSQLHNDADEFPAIGYDDILVDKCCQLYYEEGGKIEQAIAYDAKATRTMARRQEDQNKETEDMISLVANPHDTIHRKIAGRSRQRYGWFRSRF